MKNLKDTVMASECEKDYKKRHYWQKLGVVTDDKNIVYLIWRCSQCDESFAEELGVINNELSRL